MLLLLFHLIFSYQLFSLLFIFFCVHKQKQNTKSCELWLIQAKRRENCFNQKKTKTKGGENVLVICYLILVFYYYYLKKTLNIKKNKKSFFSCIWNLFQILFSFVYNCLLFFVVISTTTINKKNRMLKFVRVHFFFALSL